MTKACILRFRTREELDEEEEFALEVEHRPELGKVVADQLRQLCRGTATLADFPDFPAERVVELAEKRRA
ncbi:hypothetical protein K8R03_00575 [Candidatus Kaiserbacteria bacterium]|nr:hypothetical protein [Candidatus Kaiserbacteria bacterium]